MKISFIDNYLCCFWMAYRWIHRIRLCHDVRINSLDIVYCMTVCPFYHLASFRNEYTKDILCYPCKFRLFFLIHWKIIDFHTMSIVDRLFVILSRYMRVHLCVSFCCCWSFNFNPFFSSLVALFGAAWNIGNSRWFGSCLFFGVIITAISKTVAQQNYTIHFN